MAAAKPGRAFPIDRGVSQRSVPYQLFFLKDDKDWDMHGSNLSTNLTRTKLLSGLRSRSRIVGQRFGYLGNQCHANRGGQQEGQTESCKASKEDGLMPPANPNQV